MAQTMLGFAAPAELRAPQAQAAQAPTAQPAVKVAAKTMLGVAMPGIAPVAASAPAPSKYGVGSGTMLGVAMPGIAPIHSQPGIMMQQAQPSPMMVPQPAPPPILPAPAPLLHEAAPSAPVLSARKGFPLAIVAASVGGVVLAGGVVLLVLARSAPPMIGTATTSLEGKEQLHLVCETCPDGTTAAWKSAKATFKNKAADLDLAAPLVIGKNAFQIAIDRPGVGRDETVELVLPLTYRIRGDVDDIGATPPVVKVEVDAERGASVNVDGKPVALDANGKATLSYDVTQDEVGAADDVRTIERKVQYEVVDNDKKKKTGEVVIRVGVLPLHLDAPGAVLTTDEGAIWIAGRTSKGADVTANGTALPVSPDGTFEGKVDVTAGAQTMTLRTAPAHDAATKAAPRTMQLNVNRVASMDTETRAVEKGTSMGFDDLARDPAAALGQPIGITGSIVETRVTHHHSVLLVDDKRGCAKGPCLVRVEFGAETAFHPGDGVVAAGFVGKPITTPDGKTLPEVDASLVTKPVSSLGPGGHR
jgi:hypothetical protein